MIFILANTLKARFGKLLNFITENHCLYCKVIKVRGESVNLKTTFGVLHIQVKTSRMSSLYNSKVSKQMRVFWVIPKVSMLQERTLWRTHLLGHHRRPTMERHQEGAGECQLQKTSQNFSGETLSLVLCPQ